MRKLIASLLLLTAISSPVLAEETDQQTKSYSFYVVYHSKTGQDYWAVTQDGFRSLWFKESEVSGEILQVNDMFKATFDENGKVMTIQKYTLQ